MPQSLSSILVHLVFSTKKRAPLIVPAIETELYQYLGGVLRNVNCPAVLIGGDRDHIHLLVSVSRTVSIAKLVQTIKTSSTRWIRSKGKEFAGFEWQTGYGAFSIGQSSVDALCHYIAQQKEHHQKTSFQDEFRALCGKYRIAIDERYVWD